MEYRIVVITSGFDPDNGSSILSIPSNKIRLTNNNYMKEKGFGDRVEDIIKKLAPSIYERNKHCEKCKKRKQFLNNCNGIIK